MKSLSFEQKSHKKQDEQKKSYENRNLVNTLYFQGKIPKKRIASILGLSIKFVRDWTRSPDQNVSIDSRGWNKGTGRKYNKKVKEQIINIHDQLRDNPDQFFTGATAVQHLFQESYPGQTVPSLRSIGRILAEAGRTRPIRKYQKGASAYLCYPEHLIYNELGGRLLEADFIGQKYITGQTRPVNFIGFSFKKEPRIRYYSRIEAQTAVNFIKETERFIHQFERPDFIKVDNALAMIGSASGKRNLSKSMIFLLSNQVVPIFAVPRKPFTQASIEGNNSVFSRNFWNKQHFESSAAIDSALERFNKSSLWYTQYKTPESVERPQFYPRVLFIRQVGQQHSEPGLINILNEQIQLDPAYNNYYVLAEWNLTDETISVYFQKEKQKVQIHQSAFNLNPFTLRILKKRGVPFI